MNCGHLFQAQRLDNDKNVSWRSTSFFVCSRGVGFSSLPEMTHKLLFFRSVGETWAGDKSLPAEQKKMSLMCTQSWLPLSRNSFGMIWQNKSLYHSAWRRTVRNGLRAFALWTWISLSGERQSFEEEEFGKMAKNWSVGADDVSY